MWRLLNGGLFLLPLPWRCGDGQPIVIRKADITLQHSAEQNGDVFWSRDKRVVGYFESLFKAMQAKAARIELSQLSSHD